MELVIFGVWLVGVFIARLQLNKWAKENTIPDTCNKDVLCLLSWLVYVIYAAAWVADHIEKGRI